MCLISSLPSVKGSAKMGNIFWNLDGKKLVHKRVLGNLSTLILIILLPKKNNERSNNWKRGKIKIKEDVTDEIKI